MGINHSGTFGKEMHYNIFIYSHAFSFAYIFDIMSSYPESLKLISMAQNVMAEEQPKICASRNAHSQRSGILAYVIYCITQTKPTQLQLSESEFIIRI